MTEKEQRTKRRKRLRKQPRVRRINATASMAMPRMRVPDTATRRRKRNFRRFRSSGAALRRALFSARWASFLLLALAIGTLVLVGVHEDFYITFIPVDGVAAISPEEVVAASGLAGAHIFAIDPSEAAQQISELPGVISATVKLNWPNEVQVHIREEMPIAVWIQDDVQYWINEQGELLPARVLLEGLLVIEAESIELPIALPDPEEEATSDGEEEAEPNSGTPYLPPEILAGALELQQLRPSLTRLYFERSGGLSFVDGDGWRAYFGSGGDMRGKMVVYEAVVSDLLSRDLRPEYVSVANYEKPYYRVVALENDG